MRGRWRIAETVRLNFDKLSCRAHGEALDSSPFFPDALARESRRPGYKLTPMILVVSLPKSL
jgi:hypothetical protein